MTKKDFLKALIGVDVDKLTHVVTITQLPTGAKEVAINTTRLGEKIDYIKSAYDNNMEHKHVKRQQGMLPVKMLAVTFC